MLRKKLGSMKKLWRKVKVKVEHEWLLRDKRGGEETTPTGTFVVYVGDERQRFSVPTGYLSHPLFKILLDKAYNEFGFEQRNGLVVPCCVGTFQQVMNAIQCCNAQFDFREFVEEFV